MNPVKGATYKMNTSEGLIIGTYQDELEEGMLTFSPWTDALGKVHKTPLALDEETIVAAHRIS